MKKTALLFLFLMVSIISYAQDIMDFRAVKYCYCQKEKNGAWGQWTDWEPTDIKIVMDLTTDMIFIDSKERQAYQITEMVDEKDPDGELSALFNFVDADGVKGIMRLIKRNSGRSEIYIQFRNYAWVYEVERMKE